MSPTFRLSVGSHLAAIAGSAVAAAVYLTVYSGSRQSLADYISAICAKSLGSAPAAEAPYLAENINAMTKMMIDMSFQQFHKSLVRFSGERSGNPLTWTCI